MAQSFLEFPARGVGPYPIQALPYLDSAHLSFTVDGVPTTGTVDDAKKQVTLDTAPTGAVVRVSRTTPRDQDDRVTQFLDLVSGAAGLSGDLLDQDYRQTLYILGEARDVTEGLEGADGMMVGEDGNWNAETLKIQNLAMGSDPFDLITKAQLDAIDAATTGLPAVTGADNDDGLFVASGAWAKRTPAQSRTHLGLGTVAPLTAGVAANNALQLDSNARFPTADGRNIDLANHPTVPLRAKGTTITFRQANHAINLNINVSLATWSQNSSGRVSFNAPWAVRTELNNSGAADGGTDANGIVLAAGTWRIKWHALIRMAAAQDAAFRLTDNSNTGSQVVYVDYPPSRVKIASGGQVGWRYVFADEIILSNASSFPIVFRAASPVASAGTYSMDITVFLHHISTSVAS